jgi:hypothetical protein
MDGLHGEELSQVERRLPDERHLGMLGKELVREPGVRALDEWVVV